MSSEQSVQDTEKGMYCNQSQASCSEQRGIYIYQSWTWW